MTSKNYYPVFELTRGDRVESVHYGAIAVVESSGRLAAWYGDPQTVTFLRSTAKPFQALPFIETGGQETFDLTQAEIAIMCASHSGTDAHAAVLQGFQRKVNIRENQLKCGIHPVYHTPTAEAMKARGEEPTPNRHNCSGKHTGMLAHCHLKGWPTEDYLNPEHPLQRLILKTFAEMCSLDLAQVAMGTDGCSAPVFAVPLYNAALAFARLADPDGLETGRGTACQVITAAMTAHPDMVAGPDRFDTLLMEAGGGRIVTKGGAEAYQGIGLHPGALGAGSPALGIALKISDGDGRLRARPAVSIEVLRQLGALSSKEIEALAKFGPTIPIKNWRKIVVGEGRPAFTLETA
jgi:L-asparaginase II